MFRMQFISLLLLMGVVSLVGAQTPVTSNPQTALDRKSDDLKTIINAQADDTKTYSKAELQRRNADAKKYYTLGLKYGRAGLFKQAVELFLQSVRLKPDYADAYFGLGHAYFDLGHWEDAISAFEKAMELKPNDEEAFKRLVTAHEKLRAQQASLAGPDTALSDPASLLKIYKVGIGDVLEIRFRDAPQEQSKSLTVSENGFLEDPLLSQPVKVSGFTPEEIADNLKESIRRSSNSPERELVVSVHEYNSHVIMVSGLVQEPGTKIIRREAIPLYVVLADAQPLPEAEQVVWVARQGGNPVSLSLAEAQSAKVLIQTGDVITVQAAAKQYFYVGGQVKEPGEKLFRAGLTLTQAILSAGGITEDGKKVELTRDSAGGLLATTNYKLKDINAGKLPDPLIQPGDRIMVVH
jgi:protein involved in polysaccharide export with SLBB domain